MTERFLLILSTMVIEKLNNQAKTWENQYPFLKEDPAKWTHRHFVAMADLLGLSISFVKRLFNCPGFYYPRNINQNSQKKILLFLGLSHWDEVENKLIQRLTKQNNRS